MPLRVRNFTKFQHYAHRSPPWIKLHRSALHDYSFTRLPDASKAHAMLLWLLASTCDNAIPDDAAWIAQQIGATEPINIDLLVSACVLERYKESTRKQKDATRKQDASKTRASRKQNGGTEVEGEGEGEGEGEKREDTPLSQTDAKVPAGGWPARVAELWTREVGIIRIARVGADLSPMERLYSDPAVAEAALLKAVMSFARARRIAIQGGDRKPDNWAQFVRDLRDYLPANALPDRATPRPDAKAAA